MSEGSTITAGIVGPTLRRMDHDELPTVLAASLRRHGSAGASAPREPGRQREPFGWVAEIQGRSVGSVVCALVQGAVDSQGAKPPRSLVARFRSLLGWCSARGLYVELLDLMVEHEVGGAVLEQALLRCLLEDVQRFWSRVPVVVPESNLAAQVLLRNARYKAVRVLHAYFGDEDGYLMTESSSAGGKSPGDSRSRKQHDSGG
jgi:hypothetical protein